MPFIGPATGRGNAVGVGVLRVTVPTILVGPFELPIRISVLILPGLWCRGLLWRYGQRERGWRARLVDWTKAYSDSSQRVRAADIFDSQSAQPTRQTVPCCAPTTLYAQVQGKQTQVGVRFLRRQRIL